MMTETDSHQEETCSSSNNILLMPPGGDNESQSQNGMEVILQDGDVPRSRSRSSIRQSYNRVSKKIRKVLHFEDAAGPLKKAFMPLYWSLRIVGLTYYRRPDQKITCSMLQSIAVCVCSWGNIIRLSFAYSNEESYGATLMVKVMVHIWCLQSAIGATIFVVSFRKHIPELLSNWEEYKDQYDGVPVDVIRRKIVRAVAAFWIFYLVFLILMVAVFTNHFAYLNTLVLSNIFGTKNIPTLVHYLYQFLNVYVTVIYMLPCLALCILCHILNNEYLNVTTRLRDHMTSGDPMDYVEAIRRRHTALTRITLKLDDIISGYLLNVFALDIPILCFNIFIIMTNDSEVDLFDPSSANIVAQIGSFFVSLSHIAVVTVASISICSAAKSPKMALYETDISKLKGNLNTSLTVFLARVSQDHIGLTAWKLLNIDRRMVVTMFSLVLSYVVVLFKFGVALVPHVTYNIITNGTNQTNVTSFS